MTARAPEMANPPEAQRSRYLQRKIAGLCVRGASHGPAEPGHVLCAPCMVDGRYDRRESYRRNRATPPVNGCTRCGGTDGHNARSCNGDPLPGWAGPDTRRIERHRAQRSRRREAGVCINNPAHEKPKPGGSRCDSCMARRRKATS